MPLKPYPRRILGSIYITLIVMSVFMTVAHFKPAEAQGSTNTLPVVAVHVSENTESIWPTLLPAHPHTDWAYFAIYESLEEALRSDGTPFVEVNDSLIESGGLLSGGEPKYPILISLAAECISDLAASQILQYVSSGGFAYVGSSAWTRYSNGTTRSNFALSAEMGVRCVATPPSNWNQLTYVYRNGTNRLVDFLPPSVNISPWNLPLDNGTSIQNTGAGNGHYFWQACNTGTGPAEIVLTIPSSPSPYVMLATKAYSNGRFIYHSELTPMIGFSIYAPQMYEYTFFRRAIEWAFETRSLPLARLSPWPYQYDSAFIIRHDGDSGSSFVLGSAQREKQLGVTGQYYIMTGLLLDDPNNASYITQLQQAQDLYGAEIGPHNGGLNSHYWLGTLPGDYAYYHWGPDICIVKNGTGDYWPYVNNRTDPSAGHSTTGNSTGLYGKDYANMSIKIALDSLATWLGQRPVISVTPWADASRDDSLEVMESQGIKTAGERNFGPFPHIALSLNTKGKYYDIIEFASEAWATSSGSVYQRLEEHSTSTMQQMIDFLYSMGAMVSIYGHVSSNGGIGEAYITYCKSKPNMWNATPLLIRDWWLQRNTVRINPLHQINPDGTHNLTITSTGSTSPDTTVEITFQVSSMSQIQALQVQLDGTPTTNYRTTATGALAIKVKAGLASKITITWRQPNLWTQTSQVDFESGTLTNLDTSSGPGQVSLTAQSGGSTLFYDYFNDSSRTSSQWTVQSGNWDTGVYIQNDTSTGAPNAGYRFSYAGNSSWTDYSVEAVAATSPTSGQYFAQIGARLNPATGTRYSLWLYPATGGPNVAKLLRFSSWSVWTLIQQVSVTTNTGWHNLKMTLNGSAIACYYDGTSIINATDSTYTSGLIDCESYATIAQYDRVTVTNLAGDTGLFNDSFNNATWTSSQWTINGGTWNVEVEKYIQSDLTGTGAAGYKNSYAGDTAWTNYIVEARARYVNQNYGPQIAARLDPATGARYALWIYPTSGQGPNTARLLKFTDWSTWTQLAMTTSITTNTNWHTLRMELIGSSIRCYYDEALVMQVTDSSYTSGAIDVETHASGVEYDWITVKEPPVYYSSGTLVSSAFDAGYKAQWMTINWNALCPANTQIQFRTRTASTEAGLPSASWSSYYTSSGTSITSSANRWIQYEATFSTTDTTTSPILYDVTIYYMKVFHYNLTITASGSGTTDPTPGVYLLDEGTIQTVDAVPDSGYKLDHWDLDGENVGSSPSHAVTMNANHTLTSVYVPRTRLQISPSTIEKTAAEINSAFEVNVTIMDVQDLWGFDLNLTWDNSLLTLTSIEFNTTLDNVWGHDNWYYAKNESSPGYYKLVALSTSSSFTSTEVTPLATLTFRVEDPHSNFMRETAIHFDTHKLSNSLWRSIPHSAEDGTYRIAGGKPTLLMNPATKTCRTYNETFTVQINIANASNVEDFRFEIHYNATLLDVADVSWNAWGTGTYTVDEVNGNLTGYTSGSPSISGNATILTITFNATYTHVWKVEGKVAGWKNDQTGIIYIQQANLSYAGNPDLGYLRGGLDQINVGSDFNYTFSPIKGDIDNNGAVNIFDLRTVAAFYDTATPDYDLTGDVFVDIYDLVVIGTNFGYKYYP